MANSKTQIARLTVSAIITFCCCLVAHGQQSPQPNKRQQCPNAWQISPANPKLTEKSDAWVSENGSEDGALLLQYCQVFKSGLTRIKRIGVEKLKELPAEWEIYQRYAQIAGEKVRMDELPVGFSIYKNLAFEVQTATIMTGASVTLRLPSVKTEEEFSRLFVLYLDEDPLVPGALSWQDFGASVSEQKSDFKNRTLNAEFNYTRIFNRATGLGRLVVASFNPEEYDKAAVDLYITSVVGPPYIKLGETFQYSISIKNWGGTGQPATNVVVHSSMGGGRFVSGTATQGTCRQSTNSTPDIVCELGKLDYGKSATMTLTVRSDDLGMSVLGDEDFVFLTTNTVRSREKDYSPENNNYRSMGTIVRRQ